MVSIPGMWDSWQLWKVIQTMCVGVLSLTASMFLLPRIVSSHSTHMNYLRGSVIGM